jgi:hypothetical protein
MGITIHYRGWLKSPKLIEEVCEKLAKIAKSMEWEYTLLVEDFNKPNTAKLEHRDDGIAITGHLPLKGIQLKIHKECDSFNIFFDKNGVLQDMVQMTTNHSENDEEGSYIHVKTQFAPLGIHIAIIQLLKYLNENYFDRFEVIDEGEYWQTEDEDLLKQKMTYLSDKMEAVSHALESAGDEFKYCDSDKALAAKIEEILKDQLIKVH